MLDLATAQAAEILFSVVGAGTVKAIGLLMVDALHLETLMQAVPRGGFVSVHHGPLGDTGLDEGRSLGGLR